MSLRTFGAPLASTALRHCITIRWLSVGSAADGILLKTDFAFELLDIPDREVSFLTLYTSIASESVITPLDDLDLLFKIFSVLSVRKTKTQSFNTI